MRPAILLIDPDDDRRRALAKALAEGGYEVIPAGSSREGARFAEGLGPSVIVGPVELPSLGDTSILEQMSADQGASITRTLVLLGRGAEPEDLPDAVRFLDISDLSFEEIGRRITLVLVGREVGLEPDVELRSLVGDFALTPVLDISRALGGRRIDGRLTLSGEDGEVFFSGGEVVHAVSGPTVGSKAFCRLARRSAAPFRVMLGGEAPPPTITEPLDELSIFALEEAHLTLPDRRSRIRLSNEKRLPSGEWTKEEMQLALAIQAHSTLGHVLDNLPVRDGLLVLAIRKMMDRGALRLEPPRSSVCVVTDSTSDLPAQLTRGHGIEVVPLSVFFGKDELRDGVDITARDFYHMLQESEQHPRSEPPTDAVFFEHYHRLIEQQDIVSIHLSSRISQTMDNAQQAALRGIRSFDHLPADRAGCALEVIDSRQVSIGLGLQALFAARMAQRGEKVFAITQRLRALRDRVHMFFAVDTLDFLVRGGRLGRAQAMAGKLLGIKPILGLEDGKVVPVDRARGGRRVQPRLVQLIEAQVDATKPLVICVGHAQAPVWADRLRKLLEKRFDILELLLTDIGPTVGTHAGPGCVGAVAFQPTPEEWQAFRPLEENGD